MQSLSVHIIFTILLPINSIYCFLSCKDSCKTDEMLLIDFWEEERYLHMTSKNSKEY